MAGPAPGPDHQTLAETGPESEGQLLEGPGQQLLAAQGGHIRRLQSGLLVAGQLVNLETKLVSMSFWNL